MTTCRKCAQRIAGVMQVFAWDDDDAHIFDVSKASRIAHDGRPATTLAPDQLNGVLAIGWSDTFEPAHMDHVDPREPGLVVTLLEDGQERWALIDGNHRLAQASALGLPGTVLVLDAPETQLCLLPPFVRELLRRA